MRSFSAFVACFATFVALLCPGVAFAGPQAKALETLNEIRQSYGLPALRGSANLERSARRYAGRMLRGGYFGHAARIAVAARFRSAGETLAWHSGGRAQPRRTIRSWMNSPTHRALLLSPHFRWVGLGMKRGRLGGRRVTVWVGHLGRM